MKLGVKFWDAACVLKQIRNQDANEQYDRNENDRLFEPKHATAKQPKWVAIIEI